MRKLMLLTFLSLIVSCKKEDYRIKYTGHFLFTNEKKTFITDSTYNDTKTNFHGIISLGSESNYISIHNSPDVTFETEIKENGDLPDPYPLSLGNCFSGRFVTTDSVYFGSSCGATTGSVLIETTGHRE